MQPGMTHASTRETTSFRLSRRKKVLFTFVVALVALGVTEIFWRLHAGRKYARKLAEYESGLFEDDRFLGSKYKIGLHTIPVEGEAPVQFNINTRHLRGPEVLEPRPDGLIRILCLGGSTTFSTSSKSDRTSYPGQLESLLRSHDPGQPYEVLNAGVPGYRTVESYQNLSRLRDFAPDIVLVCHAINDICWGVDEPFYLDPTSGPRPESRLERRRREAESFFFQALWSRIFNRIPRNPKGRTELDPRIVEAFGSNLGRIAGLARKIEAIPVFLTFATRAASNTSPEVRRSIENEHPFRLTHMTWDGLLEALARLNAATRAVAERLSIDLVELEGRLPSDEALWTDFVHLKEEGTRLKVEKIFAVVAPVIERLKARRRSNPSPAEPRDAR